MRAIVVTEPGGPEQLIIGEVELAPVGPTDVRIRVAAAGVNRADIAQREGNYPPPKGEPEWPGLEVSGTITEVGAEVTDYTVGDEVCALLSGGGYADEVVVDAGLVLPIPAGVSLVEAAALPEVAATVWSNIFRDAGLQEGQVLLVHGGSSGIGSMAIQLAVARGARVATTAGSAKKLAFCADLGAETVINYREEDFAERVREEYPGRANVILDIVGGAYAKQNIRALATDGSIMHIANQSGAPMEFNPAALMVKRGRFWATTLRGRSLADKRSIMAKVREHVWPLVEVGEVRPIVDSTYAFSEAADAHRHMESSEHIGKILLLP